jgi:hypothetical protein
MIGIRSLETRRVSIAGSAVGAKRRFLVVFAVPLLLGVAGCDWKDDECGGPQVDTQAPAAPRDLYSITGDRQVTLVWLANTEPDVRGYYLWWSDRYSGPYHLIAEVAVCDGCYWMEYAARGLENGETRFYAVSAYDDSENESDLSHEEVWDTPRPEGHAIIGNANHLVDHSVAGFDLDAPMVVPADAREADFYYIHDPDTGGYLVAGSQYYGGTETTEIQDMGWTGDFDEISFAPDDVGWSPTGTAEPIAGHTYVILTREGYYAKIRLTGVDAEHVGFDWAFQSAPGGMNRQLKALGGS